MKVFTFTEARQNFASVLECAQQEGSVRITKRDGQAFVIQPLRPPQSPLEVEGVDLNVSGAELLEFVQEGRRV